MQDPARREQHLSKADFQALFGFGVEAFNALPGWKQMTLREMASLLRCAAGARLCATDVPLYISVAMATFSEQ
jgi:hypothetical protein